MNTSTLDSIDIAESFSDTAQLAALTASAIIRSVDMEADVFTLHGEIQRHLNGTFMNNFKNEESILSAQLKTLDLLFNNLMSRGIASKSLEQATSFIELGFKAQNQLRKTALALHSIQNPPLHTVIKQQNIAYNQQINNGQSDKKINLKNELLSKGGTNEALDRRGSPAAVEVNSGMATLEKINRT